MKSRSKLKFFSHLVWLAVLACAIWYLQQHGKVVADISQFMPQSSSQRQLNILLNEMQQGAASRYLLLRVQAADDQQSAQLSRDLKQRLAQSSFFSSTKNGEQGIDLDRFASLYQYRYLLSAQEDFSTDALRHELEQRLGELRSGMGIVLKQTLTSDPQNMFLKYLWQLYSRGQPEKHLGLWFDKAHRGAMLLVTLKGIGYDLDQQAQAIDSIHRAFAQTKAAHNATLEISGPAVMAVATRESIQSTMFYLSCVAGGLLLVLFLWGYRSLKRFLLAGLPLATAILVALFATNMVFSQVHGIVIAFGITLLGVCLDLPLHLFSHLQRNESPVQTLTSIWPTLRLSVITTAFSYVALMGTGFAGLSQLAVFAIAGLLSALLVTRWIVPHWLSADDVSHQVILPPLQCSKSCRTVVVLVGMVLPLTVLWLKADQLWSKDIASLSPVPRQAQQLEKTLQAQMSTPDVNHVFFVQANDAEALLQQVERLSKKLEAARAQKIIQQVFSVSDLLPSQQRQRDRQAQLPETNVLSATLSTALKGLPFNRAAFSEFENAIEKSKSLPPLTWQDMQQTPLAGILNQDMFQAHGQWLSMIRLTGVDEARFQTWLAAEAELQTHYLNLRQASSALMHEYQQIALLRLLLGMVIIALLLGLITRSLKTLLRLVLPILLAVLITLGLQVAMGTALTLFHILALLLVVGMGLDYSLFFNRPVAQGEDLKRRTHGVMMSAGSTLAAFGVMSFTAIPVLAALGQTVSIGVLCCYVLAQLLAEPQQAK